MKSVQQDSPSVSFARLLASAIFILSLFAQVGYAKQSIYKVIVKNHKTDSIRFAHDETSLAGEIDTGVVRGLSNPLKGMLALYSAVAGTNCHMGGCELTTILGLGEQQSPAHKAMIQKYFPRVKLAKEVLADNCYLRQTQSSIFNEFSHLTLRTNRDTVIVNYRINCADHDEVYHSSGSDYYLLQGDSTFRAVAKK